MNGHYICFSKALTVLILFLSFLCLSGCCGVCSRNRLQNSLVKPIAPTCPSTTAPPTPTTPTISALTPKEAISGGPEFRLKVDGTNFVNDSQVCWNGTPRATKYITDHELSAHISEADIQSPGDATIVVTNKNTGETSAGVIFSVRIQGKVILNEEEHDTGATLIVNAKGEVQVVDALTAGAVIQMLRAAVQELHSVLQDASNDAIAVGQSLEANAHAVLADMDDRMKNRMDTLVKDLHREERQMAEDAKKLAEQMSIASNQLLTQSTERAKITMYDADILAYNTVQNLPCNAHAGRLVYASTLNDKRPLQLRLGIDPNEITIHGSWLDLDKPQVKLDGKNCYHKGDTGADPVKDCVVNAFTERDILIQFPDGFIDEPQNPEGKTVAIGATTKICTPKKFGRTKIKEGGEKSVLLTVLPRIEYTIYVKIWPTAVVRSGPKWDWSHAFSASADCDGHSSANATWRLPNSVDYDLVKESFAQIAITSRNCDSDLDGSPRYMSNYSVLVPAHVGGCGKDCVLGICNCKGRGWLGYTIALHYYEWARNTLPLQEHWKVIPGGSPASLVFDYQQPLPPPAEARDYEWHYYVRVLKTQGGSTIPFEFTEDNQSSDGISTSQNISTGAVSVSITEAFYK